MNKKKLRKIYRRFFVLKKINLIKTVYFNFKMLPFSQARHLPILLFGKINFLNLTGKITIEAPVRLGMIKIGYRWFDLWPSCFAPTQIQIQGLLTFESYCVISGGCMINVTGKNASIYLGNGVLIGSGTVVKSLDKIHVGRYTRITGGDTIVFNSNMHYVVDLETGTVKNDKGPIYIGERCWINGRCVINKGAVIPNGCVVARNSFAAKDYSEFGENLFLVGSPAKPTSKHCTRIFDAQEQGRLYKFFMETGANECQIDLSILEKEPELDSFFTN